MASVLDQQTNDFLNSLTSIYAWIGGYKSNTGSWMWSDGSAWGYTNWAVGQPNNYGGNQENIAIRGNGDWDDINGKTGGSRFQPYICRIQKGINNKGCQQECAYLFILI